MHALSNPATWAIYIPIAIAIASLIVIPLMRWVFKDYFDKRAKARMAELAKLFVSHDEIHEKHEENKKLLEAIRHDGKEREGRLTGLINAMSVQNQTFQTQVSQDFRTVNGRVDSVLQMVGDRRRRT